MSPLYVSILLPVLAAAFVIAGAPARRTALTAAVMNLLLAIYVAFAVGAREGYHFTYSLPVFPELGLNLAVGVDGLGLVMLVLTTLVTVCALWAAPEPENRKGLYYASLLFISAGAVGAFVSTDVFFFYIFHELALIPTFLLIGIWGSGDRQAAAWKVTIYLAAGSFVLLLGLLGMYFSIPEGMRTFDMQALRKLAETGAVPQLKWVYLLLLFGFGILISLFPFHTWAPQAYASAPTPAAMLHAGVLKKFGLYGLIRLVVPLYGETVDALSWLLLLLLAGNILYVGLVTISQKKLDWMLGYSSVMHMGYIFLGIAALNLLSLTGASVLMFAHGLSIAALFALCGEIRARTGTLDFAELGGLAKTTPKLGLLFGFAAMASLGLPGFANFAGEIMIFFGAFARGEGLAVFNAYQVVTVIAVWGVVISAVYMLRAYRAVFMGEASRSYEGVTDIAPHVKIAVLILLVVLLVAGFVPRLLTSVLTPAIFWP